VRGEGDGVRVMGEGSGGRNESRREEGRLRDIGIKSRGKKRKRDVSLKEIKH
jgi:hypothetical protein